MAGRRDSPVQYTIRGIPPAVDRALRKKARERKISLNRLLVDELAGASGVEAGKRRSLEELAGTWEDDPGFDHVVAGFREQIDRKLWK